MSPEQSLIEFISTSASLHGVKKMSLRNLEWDLLKVCAIVHLNKPLVVLLQFIRI